MSKLHLFRIALLVKSSRSAEHWTAERFARELGISPNFLYQMLRGDAVSERTGRAIDAFIDEELSLFQSQMEAA